jgi:hypothetical protein
MKYRFKIYWQPPELIIVNKMMVALDCWKEGEGSALEETIQFNYTGEPRTISYFKDFFDQYMESQGCKLIHFEGGPYE